MSRLGITLEQVEQVANAVLQAGQNPTIERIRSQLGTGSASTISKYLLMWRNKRVHGYEIESSIFPPDPVNQAVKKVWQQLQTENHAKLEALETEAAKKIQLAQEEKDQALDELQRAKEDNQNLRALLKEVRDKDDGLEKEQIRLNQVLVVLETKYQTIEKADKNFQQFANEALSSVETKYKQAVTQYETKLAQTKEFHIKELSQMKEMAESQRHQHIVAIDHLKTMNQKLQAQLSDKDKAVFEITSRVGQLSSQLQNQQGGIADTLAIIQQNEKMSVRLKEALSQELTEVMKQETDKQTQQLLLGWQKQLVSQKESNQSANGKVK